MSVCPTLCTWASPTDAINRALWASGTPSAKEARPTAFIIAFSIVAIQANDKLLPSYISAAVTLRPDLADQIIAAALKSRLPKDRSSFDLIAQMVKAAIAAAPEARNAIVKTALAVCPWARESILAAAGVDLNEIAFFRLAGGVNVTPTGTLNPSNFFTENEWRVQSPEQPPAP